VLRGEMSFIGPRPERPHFVAQLEELLPSYRERLRVKPGLTGWAQVNYPYGASVEDARAKLSYDLYYVKHRGLLLDLLILLARSGWCCSSAARADGRSLVFHREPSVNGRAAMMRRAGAAPVAWLP